MPAEESTQIRTRRVWKVKSPANYVDLSRALKKAQDEVMCFQTRRANPTDVEIIAGNGEIRIQYERDFDPAVDQPKAGE